jgi:two-component sensor histidine kinase
METQEEEIKTNLISIKNRLTSIAISHPNLYKLWKNYINIKIKHYDNIVKDSNIFLDNIVTKEDFTPEMIALLMVLKNEST